MCFVCAVCSAVFLINFFAFWYLTVAAASSFSLDRRLGRLILCVNPWKHFICSAVPLLNGEYRAEPSRAVTRHIFMLVKEMKTNFLQVRRSNECSSSSNRFSSFQQFRFVLILKRRREEKKRFSLDMDRRRKEIFSR